MPILEELPQSDILPRGSWTTELPEVKDPSAGEVISAAFANENEVVAGINALMRARNFKPIEGYSAFSDPASDARLLDQYPDHFKGIRSPDERSARESTIRREEANAEVIQSAGWAGTFAAVGAGLASPTMFLPGGAVYKAGRLGYRIARTAASVAPAAAIGTAVQEGALHSFTHTRTATQSAVAIGGSAVFGGLVGAGVAGAARISRGEWEALLRTRQRDAAEAGGFPVKPFTGDARYVEREVTPHVGPDDGADVLRDADALRTADPVSDPASIVARAPDGEVAPAIKANQALGDRPPIVARDLDKALDEAAPTAEPAKVASGPEPARYSQREVRRYVALTDGSDEFGYITSDIARAIGVEPAPIRLPAGQHNHATDKGYGEVHIQARHGAELFEAGYDDVAQFTLDVVKRFDAIYEGHGGALLLVKQGERNQIAVIDLRPFGIKDDVNWEVATAAIYKPKYFKNKKLLWSRPDSANFPPTGEPPFGPRSQSHLNITETGQDFNPARAGGSSPGVIEDAAVLGSQVALPRQSVVDLPKQDAPLDVRGEEPASVVPKSEVQVAVPQEAPATSLVQGDKEPALTSAKASDAHISMLKGVVANSRDLEELIQKGTTGNLSLEETTAIRLFTTEIEVTSGQPVYSWLNNSLQKDVIDENISAVAALLNRALSKRAVDEATIYRGVRADQGRLDNFRDAMNSGGVIIIKEFQSFSTDKKIAMGFSKPGKIDDEAAEGLVLVIKKNRKAPSIQDLSSFPEEAERLHPSHSKFRVLKVERTPDQYIEVELEQVID